MAGNVLVGGIKTQANHTATMLISLLRVNVRPFGSLFSPD